MWTIAFTYQSLLLADIELQAQHLIHQATVHWFWWNWVENYALNEVFCDVLEYETMYIL